MIGEREMRYSMKLSSAMLLYLWAAVCLQCVHVSSAFIRDDVLRGHRQVPCPLSLRNVLRASAPEEQASAKTSAVVTDDGSADEVTETPPPFDVREKYTGERRDLDWKLMNPPVPLRSEIALLKSGVLIQRGEYCAMRGNRLAQLQKECEKLGMTVNQAFIIRKQILVTNVVQSAFKYTKHLEYMEEQFSTAAQDIAQLSKEMELPPVGIIRSILRRRVDEAHPKWRTRDLKRLVKQIIANDDEDLNDEAFLSSHEWEQLQLAKANDIVAFQKDASEIFSDAWEQDLYDYLDKHNIRYMSENDLRDAGCERTPDCLFLDDVYINGRPVRWIDSKSFYASGLKQAGHTIRKTEQQVERYERVFDGGRGALIYKHGFSRNFARKNPHVLFLDAGPLDITNVKSEWDR